MKKLLFLIALLGAFAASTFRVTANVFDDLRANVLDQYVLATNAPVVDSKLAKSLLAAIKAIDKNTTTNVATGIKTLGSAAKVLNRTSLSNVFQPDLQAIVEIYIEGFAGNAQTFSNLLASAFPSSQKDSALASIGGLLTTLHNAGTNQNITAVVKLLGTANKQVTTIQKLVTSAQNVPAPAASVQATINVSGVPSFNFRSTTAANSQVVPGNFNIIAAQVITTGSGLNTVVANHVINFNITGLVNGVNNLNTVAGSYTRSIGGLGGIDPSSGAFPISSGTVQATWNPDTKAVYGTFSFNVAETSGAMRSGTVSGSFTTYYQ